MSRTPMPQPLVNQAGWPDAPEAVVLLDPRGIIRFATPATAEFYGFALEDIIGRSALRFLAPESVEHISFIWRMFVENEHLRSHAVHATMISAAGHHIPIRASLWRVPGQRNFLLIHHIMDYLRDRLDTLYSLISTMSSTLALDDLVDTILREVHRLIPCETSTIFMIESDRSVQIRRWREGEIETERSLPSDHYPEFPTSREMRESGQPLIVHDTLADPRWVTLENHRSIRSWLGAPLIHRGEYLGELTLDNTEPNNFDTDDAELAHALAIQIAAALHNVRQFEAEQRRAKRFQALSDVSEAINRLELDEVLELVHAKVSALMDADVFFIGLYDAEGNRVRIAGFYDQGRRVPDTIIPDNSGLTGQVLQSHESIIIQDTASDPRIENAVMVGDTPHSLMIMPLIAQDEIVGVISVQSYKPYAYPPDDIALLEVIADAVATAVRNAQLYDQTVTQLREQQSLHRLSLDLATSQSPERISEFILGAALEMLIPTEVRFYLCGNPSWESQGWIGTAAPGSDLSIHTIDADSICDYLKTVRASGRALVFDSLTPGEPPLHFGTDWPVQSAGIYPVMRGDRQLGTLVLLFDQPHTMNQDEQRVIDMLCLQAGSALENALYMLTLTRRLDEVTALQELARSVSGLNSLDDILNTVARTVHDALDCKSASVALLEPDGETITLRAGSGLDDRYITGQSFAMGEYVAGAVVASGKVIYVRDTHTDPNFRIIDPEVRALMSVPLTVQRRTIGTLNIDAATPDAFNTHHERILTIAGGQIAAAIENLRLLEQARQDAAELAKANESLAAQDELRRELVFQVSHDLRGPLQIVYGYTDMMHDEMLGPITPTQKDVLELVLRRSKSIERMTHDILNARPINHQMLELQTLDLTEMCQQALTDAQMMYKGRNENLAFSGNFVAESLPVEADYNRLSRVFDNLIGNAVKFSPGGGTVCLSTNIDRDRVLALVSVSDEGIGIGEEKLPFIFERFYRGDRTFRKQFEGAGLGLYIVQQIIEAHHGQIWAESEPGAGSVFTFALPLIER